LLYKHKTVYVTHYQDYAMRLPWLKKAIVNIPIASGSGAIISKYGHILTAAHVVDDADFITVRFYKDHTEYTAKVLKVDTKRDLALLKVIGVNKKLPYYRLEAVSLIGDDVTVIGHPFALDWAISKGCISGTYENSMTIDAAVNPGNSGGPVLNEDGRLIGITSAMISPIRAFTGIGVIVAGNEIVEFMEDFYGLHLFWR